MFYRRIKQTASDSDRGIREPWPLQPTVSELQWVLTYCLSGLGLVTRAAVERGIEPLGTGVFTARALVATHGPTAADPHRLIELIQQAVVLRDQLREQISTRYPGKRFPPGPADFEPATTFEGLLKQARQIRLKDLFVANKKIFFLKQFLLAGIRSIAAYADHAYLLGRQDDLVSACLLDSLVAIHRNDVETDELVFRLCRDCAGAAQRAVTLLDTTCIRSYGRPQPDKVPLGFRKGRAILVSGRDFGALEALLRQTRGRDIRVYSHGEMLDAHQHPELAAYPQFTGHYEETTADGEDGFSHFPGPVLLTAGSPVPGDPGPGQRLFSSAELSRAGMTHIIHGDVRPVIDQALDTTGFTREEVQGEAVVGNSEKDVAGAAEEISDCIKEADGHHILLAADCPMAGGEQSFQIPRGGLVSLVCGKNRQDLHPPQSNDLRIRLGRSHDPRIVVRMVKALATALQMDAGDLPLTVNLSWCGQKTAGVMLALIGMGLEDIRLGPALPTGIEPDLVSILGNPLGFCMQTVGQGDRTDRERLRKNK